MKLPNCQKQTGVVYVEFLISFIPIFIFIMGLIQLGLMYGADILVTHAANTAARAAIVILPDDEEDYDGVSVNTVKGGNCRDKNGEKAPDNGRRELIRKAAKLSLLPVSPKFESFTEDSVASAIGGRAVDIFAGLFWTDANVAVSFPDSTGGYNDSFGGRQAVTVRVKYLFKCSIPIVKGIMCDKYDDLDDCTRWEMEANGKSMSIGSRLTDMRLVAMSAESTLPNQGI